MKANKRILLIFVIAYSVLLPGMNCFIPTSLVEIPGILLIITAVAGGGMKGGIPAAIWSSLTMLPVFLRSGGELHWHLFISGVVIFCILAVPVGKMTDILRRQRDKLAGKVEALEQTECALRKTNDEMEHLNKELENSQKNISRILDVTPVGILMTDEDLIINRLNDSMVQFIGKKQEEILGKRIGEGIGCINSCEKGCGNGEECKKCALGKAAFDVFTSGKTAKGMEIQYTQLINGVGTHLWLRLNITLVNIDGHRNVIMAADNITEGKRMEEALAQSRNFYLTLFEEFPALIWRAGVDGKCNYFNKSWLDFTGRTMEQEWGDGWAENVHPEDLQQCFSTYMDAFHARRPFEMEYRMKRHDGLYRWILDMGRPFKDMDGNFYGYLGSCYDITERKIAEEGLTRYKILSERARDIMLFVNVNGDIIEANHAALGAYGYTREEMLSLSIFDLRKADGRTFVQEQLRQADHQGILFETAHYRKDGSTFPVEVNSQGTEINGKKMILSVARDITERKKAQEELEKAKEAAEAANLSKSEFLANMSHEIRTPMNGIIGMGELLSTTPLSGEQKEYLDMITSSSNTLLKIINDILDFSKIESGKLEIEELDFDFRNTVEKTADAFALRAHEKGLELSCFIYDDIPDVLCGDPGRLRQILVNLVGNAIKFTGKGEVTVIAQKIQDDGDRVLVKISVADTGIGIAADKIEYIFKSFTQADGSHTRKYGGTGLGLSISRQLVELMRGKITVDSTVGSGSTFSFTIPFPVGKSGRISRPFGSDIRVDKLKGLRILVVDDNATNRKILFHMLQGQGISVELATGGEEGIELVKKFNERDNPFDMILLDAHMPHMDGFAFAERIKDYIDLNKTTIMMLTSVGVRGDAVRCHKLGISSYLVKPVKKHDLFEAISNISAKGDREDLVSTRHAMEKESAEMLHGALDCYNNINILLAEDNFVNIRLTTALLKRRGWNVINATNGIKALAALEKHTFDVVLMDVQMPEMDGLEATRKIRAEEKDKGTHIPILAMTAYAMKEDREKCMEAGMDDYISKPVHSAELYKAIEGLLEKRQDRAPVTAGLQAGLERMLAVLDGDRQELGELINDFLEDSRRQMRRISSAICDGNAEELEKAAHGLKGAIANFYSGEEYDLAYELENIGRLRGPDLKNAAAVFEDLKLKMEALYIQLKGVLPEAVF